jgi:hypothetical protein
MWGFLVGIACFFAALTAVILIERRLRWKA